MLFHERSSIGIVIVQNVSLGFVTTGYIANRMTKSCVSLYIFFLLFVNNDERVCDFVINSQELTILTKKRETATGVCLIILPCFTKKILLKVNVVEIELIQN